MKFDVIVGNPPYQTKSDAEDRKTKAIWPDFVKQSFGLSADGGYVCLIHPSGWRQPAGMFEDIQSLLKSKNIKYLELHDDFEGVETFGVQTTYDWYIAQNNPPNGNTIVKGQDGSPSPLNISDMPFIPNGMFETVLPLLAKPGEEKCEIIYSRSDYGTDKENMSKEKTGEFRYPCIYTTQKDGTINYWYSSTNAKGHFGIPKVFWSNGWASTVHVDDSGKYGLTQFAYAIVDSKDNLEYIKKAMESKKFLKLMRVCSFGQRHRYFYKIFRVLRKDFWKQFADANGNEIK